MNRATKRRTKAQPSHPPVVPNSWLHEPFLERAADPGLADSGQTALGAFLTLRLIDRFSAGAAATLAEALKYQTHATRDYLLDLQPLTPEAGHLLEVVRVADAVRTGNHRRLLWAPLHAYAYWLEQELRLAEALDVVDTGLRLNSPEAASQETAARLQRARILRLLGRFDEARQEYEGARATAVSLGDMHSALLGRIGGAIVMRHVGNLPGSEQALRDILVDAEELGDRDALARAHHDLGGVLVLRKRTRLAIKHLYLAFESYEHPEYRLRALSDAGEALKGEGHHQAAHDAFMLVLNGRCTPQTRVSTLIQLLQLSAMMRDRVAFARWRGEVAAVVHELPPERLTDYQLQLGRGHAEFGQVAKAREALHQALTLADRYGLNEYAFEAQAALDNLKNTSTRVRTEAVASTRAEGSEELLEIAEKLQALRAD